ncbi:MAG TPA: carbohydrate ABC transporter permease [Aggregatilineaceae bacterium]|nr:carbohydrate ABC transporter permease [Aggregatilineaceae bacterium]
MNGKRLHRTTLTGSQLLLMAIALIVTIIYFFPVFWMFSTSIKPPEQVLKLPPILVPAQPQFDSYLVIFGLPSSIKMSTPINGEQYFVNSFIIALSTTGLTLLMAVPAAYGLARTRIRGRTVYLLFLLTAQMLPSVLLVIPLFVLFKPLGLINSYGGVILADTALALPFAIIILRTSFLQIPLDLEEAALIDGCSRPQALLRIIVPLVRSGVVAVSMFSFLTAWGEFVFALSFLQNTDLQPVSVGIFRFIGMYTTSWGPLMAFSVLIALPALIAFLLLQKQFIGGLTTGAVK